MGSIPVWNRPPCGMTESQALLDYAKSELLRTHTVWVVNSSDIDWHEDVAEDWDARECVCVRFWDGSGEVNTYSDAQGLDIRVVSGPDWDRSGPQDVLIEVRDNWFPDDGARDSPAQKTVRVAVARCDWAVAADLDIRIDCVWLIAPLDWDGDFFNGGTKVFQSATVNPLLPCYRGPSRFFLDGSAENIGTMWISGVPFQAYGRTIRYDDFNWNPTNCPPCVAGVGRPGQRPTCNRIHPPDRATFVELGGGAGGDGWIRFLVETANPCVLAAPPIDADVLVELDLGVGPATSSGCPPGIWAAASGSHDAFPTYDLVVEGINLHLSQHCVLGSGPNDLIGFDELGNSTKVTLGTNPPTWVQVR